MFQRIKELVGIGKRVSALEEKVLELEKTVVVLTQKVVLYNKNKKILEESKKELEKTLTEEERKRKKQLKEEKKKKKYIPVVMEATGWDWDTVNAKMERAKEIAGSSYEDYAIYRFWELTEEEQKTYFTKEYMRRLWRKYNKDPKIRETLMNKDLCCKKLEAYLGRPWMATEGMTYDAFIEKFGGEEKIVYKPRASTKGHGFRIFDFAPENRKSVYEEICELPDGILEGYLVQHPEMKKLSLKSVNTVRIVTVRTKSSKDGIEKNKLHFMYAGVRMGQGSSVVDNVHSGGLVAVVDIDTGKVITPGVDHLNCAHYKHPDTDVEIIGFKIPFFDEAKKMLEEASKDLPGYFGWDVAITENGPVIVEVNTSPGATILQTPYVPEKRGMRHVADRFLQ